MFGNNAITKQETTLDTLAVQEVFPTLQGEGPFSGLPAVFVRLAGCNLACTFCDTEFDSGLNNRIPVDELVRQVKYKWDAMSVSYLAHQKPLVVVTGGEPLRQAAVVPFIEGLVTAGMQVQIETAGTVWPEDMEQFFIHVPTHREWEPPVVIVCSPKTPEVHARIKRVCVHWKYVIRCGEVSFEDGLPMRGTQRATFGQVQRIARPLDIPAVTVWVSPCDDYDEEQNKRNVSEAAMVALRYGYRLSLQTHKLAGLP